MEKRFLNEAVMQSWCMSQKLARHLNGDSLDREKADGQGMVFFSPLIARIQFKLSNTGRADRVWTALSFLSPRLSLPPFLR